ncbi:hypothetical protein SKAU_G00123170 [Synaphobranchus kaupii]|uniref:Uncharacterized protein n=1 Tax=Synaphobranchus kaupii TaxID=118154 RepID=A0A9Q1J290_SYNKA|nr:hypothetical protein SKAU_G00123170 [Synaphobranchus kaupii]
MRSGGAALAGPGRLMGLPGGSRTASWHSGARTVIDGSSSGAGGQTGRNNKYQCPDTNGLSRCLINRHEPRILHVRQHCVLLPPTDPVEVHSREFGGDLKLEAAASASVHSRGTSTGRGQEGEHMPSVSCSKVKLAVSSQLQLAHPQDGKSVQARLYVCHTASTHPLF